jgi:hypothetical protein
MILSAAVGLALAGGAALLLLGRSQAAVISDLDGRAARVSARTVRTFPGLTGASLASSPPLFPAPSGSNAATDLAVSVEGVARSPGRIVALLSIGGKPAEWLALGESRDGVTLEDVGSASVTIDTAGGERTLALGGGGPPSAAALASADGPPPGYRAPPEPASAPGMTQ